MFEKELIALYEKRGWIISRRSVLDAKRSDIIGQKGENQASFKLKKQDKPLELSIARELLGTVVQYKSDFGILVCTGGFTPSVHNLATNNQITLIDIDSLVQMHTNNS